MSARDLYGHEEPPISEAVSLVFSWGGGCCSRRASMSRVSEGPGPQHPPPSTEPLTRNAPWETCPHTCRHFEATCRHTCRRFDDCGLFRGVTETGRLSPEAPLLSTR